MHMRKNMKILLGDGPVPMSRSYDSSSSPNLGALSIIAYARRQMPDLDINYFRVGRSLDEFISRLAADRPDLYGMSFATPVASHAIEGARELKKKLPDCILVGGGAHPTISGDEVMKEAPFDYLVRGEGEITFLELVKALLKGRDPKDIPGLWIRTPDGVISTPPRPVLPDFNDLPMPAWDLIDFDEYTGPNLVRNKPATAILVSRGCPFRCVFCSNPVWHEKNNRRVRARKPNLIAEEILYLYNRGIREIYIRSDEFNFSLPWAKDVCRAIINLDLKDMSFQLNLRADHCDAELTGLLKRMGCWLVHLGVESANQRVLNGIRKGIRVQQIEQCCSLLKDAGVKVYAFLMMYQVWEDSKGNLQVETPKEVSNTLRFTRNMFKKHMFHYMSWQMATPIAGSELARIAKRHNLVLPDSKADNVWEPSMKIPGISHKDVLRHRRRGMLLQSFNALMSGHLNFSAWRRILKKIRYILSV